MYWIYLIIFTFIVFVPSFIQTGFFSLSIIQTQEYAILLIGLLSYCLFYLREKKLKKTDTRRMEIQREVNRISKDLNQSYSYIGEINRKLEILKSLLLQYPENELQKKEHGNEFFHAIISDVKTITKSPNVTIRITDSESHILKEISNNEKSDFKISSKTVCERSSSFCETPEYFMICSSFNSHNLQSCIIISRKDGCVQKIEDVEFIKALACYALFLYVFTKRNKY